MDFTITISWILDRRWEHQNIVLLSHARRSIFWNHSLPLSYNTTMCKTERVRNHSPCMTRTISALKLPWANAVLPPNGVPWSTRGVIDPRHLRELFPKYLADLFFSPITKTIFNSEITPQQMFYGCIASAQAYERVLGSPSWLGVMFLEVIWYTNLYWCFG